MKYVQRILWVFFAAGFWLAPAAMAQDGCEDIVQACLIDALDEYAECVESCNIFEGRRWDVCTGRCETKTRRSETACEENSACSPTPVDRSDSSGASPPRPMKAEGTGCYLGECPDDLPTTTPTTKPVQTQPDTSPYTTAPQPYPQPQPVQLSWVCQTPQHWCMMNQSPQALPVGSPCYCVNPIYGYANGFVIPMQ